MPEAGGQQGLEPLTTPAPSTHCKGGLCRWAVGQVQECGSEATSGKSYGLLTQPAVSAFPPESLLFPAAGGAPGSPLLPWFFHIERKEG